MTRKFTIWFQLAAIFVQLVIIPIPIIPAAWLPVIHGLIAFCQAAQAVIAHGFTPDGYKL